MKPQFTNNELQVIQNRVNHPGLLVDMVPINETFRDPNHVIEKITDEDISTQSDYVKLGLMALSLSSIDKIDKITSLDLLEGRFEPYPYQLKVVLNVLKEKSGTALLADEVGLGKTIEVGIIMKEQLLRQNIDSILIITPRALVTQWQDELNEKFDEAFITQDDDNFDYDHNRLILSFNKLSRNIDKIDNRQWDLIIVDEAHMLINTKSKRRQAVALIPRRYMLLCTATPLCNKLTDIYSLSDLLYPGILGTERDFRKNYFHDKTGRVIKPHMRDELKKSISRVMVRTLRKESNIPFPKRYVHTLRIKGTPQEYNLFDETLEYMRNHMLKNQYTSNTKQSISYLLMKELISLQQSLSSSPSALIKSLQNKIAKDETQASFLEPIINKAKQVFSYSKVEVLLDALTRMPDSQAVVFTLRLETAYLLSEVLNENYMSARVYEGRLSGFERQNLVRDFRAGKVKYIIATDAAAEGLNLQTANIVVNYDLHWNPMKLEQRIGRVHRRGQEQDVTVFNIVIQDTIDDYVLKVLFEKIDLFQMTVGIVEAVLSEINEEKNLEETIMDILLKGQKKRNIEKELDKLKNDFEYKRQQNALREELSSLVLD